MSEASFERDPVEALAEEFLQRRWRGESVSIEEYVRRHPQWAERIRDVFSTALWLEELREGGAKWEKPARPPEQKPAATNASSLGLDRLGDFRIIREIGRGGMGVVYEAEQESLGRRVAVKVLPGVYLSSPKALRRFRREAQAAARLHHTNIIPVFGVGQQDGIHYYVMQYIRGLALDEVLEELSQHLPTEGLSGSTLSAPSHAGKVSAEDRKKAVADQAPLPEIAVGKTPPAREEVWQLARILLEGGFAGASGLSLGAKRAAESTSSTQPIAQSGAQDLSRKEAHPGSGSSSAREKQGESPGREMPGCSQTPPGAHPFGSVNGPPPADIAQGLPRKGHESPEAEQGLLEGAKRARSPVSDGSAKEAPSAIQTEPAERPRIGGQHSGPKAPGDSFSGESGAEGRMFPARPISEEATAGCESVPLKIGVGYWRSVAGIGIQVAHALHYAHQQGTLHRDIKPGNLILDTEGRVWVADFGLAKLLDQEDMTRSGDVVGTLRYMAPEQFEGRADPRTDVYGLGLTLYELLTLRPAFDETDRGRLIRQVMEEEPPPPRKLCASVPRDLETIVLKAIARHPEHRYQTAAELAEDLERFLDDRPVRARRISIVERAWRWCRRNKAVAVLSSLVVGLLVTVAVVASIGYARTSAALRRESYQRSQAETARKAAESEYSRAESNLRVAMEAFEDIFHRIVAEPVFQPRAPAREETESEESASTEEPWEVHGWTSVLTEKDAAVLQTMLAFYDRFAEQNAENQTLQKETAQAYRRMGEIYHRLGNYEEAEKALTKARAHYARMGQDERMGEHIALERAVVENRLGDVYWITGRWSEALQCHHKAREILTHLSPEMAETAACRLELARTYSALGRSAAVRWMGRRSSRKPGPSGTPREELPDAGACYRQALELLQPLVEQSPHRPEYRLMLARTYRELATFAGRRLSPEEITAARQKSLALLEKLAADFPANPDYQFELAEAYAAIARGSGRMMPSEEDRRRLQEALRIESRLVEQYPHVPDYQAALARLHSEQARVFAVLGQFAEAEKHLRQAIALQQGLADRFPQSPPYQFELARQLFLLSATLRSQGKKEENRKVLEDAIRRAEKLLDRPDRAVLARMFLSWAYTAHAETLQQLGQKEQAAESRRKAEQYRPKDQAGPPMPWFPGGPWGFPGPRPKGLQDEPKPKPAPLPLPKEV